MIDWSRVEELRSDLGSEDFAEITALFLDEVEEKLETLSSGGSMNLADDFHFLKGSAANLGFAKLRDLCLVAENAQNFGDISALVAAYESSKSEFLTKV